MNLLNDNYYRHVIFDLDGTLINSAPSILNSMGSAIKESGYTPLLSLDSSLIGPPLYETIANVTGLTESCELNLIVDRFKKQYDEKDCLDVTCFSGASSILERIKLDSNLILATNKRLIPTEKILKHLEWDDMFNSIYTLDTFDPPLKNKTELLRKVISEEEINTDEAVYIGDRLDDEFAAKENKISFIMVDWSYSI